MGIASLIWMAGYKAMNPGIDDPRLTLVNLIRDYGDGLARDWKRCEALLRDHCGRYRREIFILVSIARKDLISALLVDGKHAAHLALTRVAKRAHDQLGLDLDYARWGVETWALALGAITSEECSKDFNCPSCGAGGRASCHWVQQAAICPRCKSQVLFSEELVPSIIRKGAQATTKNVKGRWILLGADDAIEDLAEARLQDSIRDIVADSKLSLEEKARRLDLRYVLAVMADQLVDVLDELGLHSTKRPMTESSAVLGALLGIGPLPGLYVGDAIPHAKCVELRRSCGVPETEQSLGMIDFTCFGADVFGVLFGSKAMYFRSRSGDQSVTVEAIPYKQFLQRVFLKHGLHQISLGANGQLLDLSGSGITKNAMLCVLNVIKQVLVCASSPSPAENPLA